MEGLHQMHTAEGAANVNINKLMETCDKFFGNWLRGFQSLPHST